MTGLARYTPFLPLVVFCGACTTSVSAPVSPAALMLGEWSYAVRSRTAESPILNGGLRVGVAIDSIDGSRFWGRVTVWFAGDVGTAPAAFGRVSGSIDVNDEVVLVIPREPPNQHPLTVIGELAGDVLTVRDCHMGTEPGPFWPGSAFLRLKPGETNS